MPRTWVVLSATLLLAACATQPGKGGAPQAASKARAPELSHQRLILSEGYSILYQDAETMSRAKFLIYVKEESDDFEQVIVAVAEFGSELKVDLERVDRDYPGVRINLDPLPEMEKRKRKSTGVDKFIDNAPIIGKSGPEYERTFLISISNGLNQERHLAEEMTNEEPDPGLKKFLLGVQRRMDALYARTEALLQKTYYRPI